VVPPAFVVSSRFAGCSTSISR